MRSSVARWMIFIAVIGLIGELYENLNRLLGGGAWPAHVNDGGWDVYFAVGTAIWLILVIGGAGLLEVLLRIAIALEATEESSNETHVA